jgi:hypothetical protein
MADIPDQSVPPPLPLRLLPPRSFTCTISADSSTLYLNFPYGEGAEVYDLVEKIYYIDGTLVSPDQIALPEGFEAAKKSQSKLVTTVTLDDNQSTVPLAASAFPHGGWFWGVLVIPAGPQDRINPSTVAVPLAQNSLNTAPPSVQVTGPLVAVSSVTRNGVACKQLLFSWTNPTTLDATNPLASILIVMYNYLTLGEYQEVTRFYCNPVRGMPAATSNAGVNGVNGLFGPVYLIADHDGAHNVTFYFVTENAALQHAPNYASIPAASYAVVGGV